MSEGGRFITFRQFIEMARRRNLTVQSLARRFRGRVENPFEFFTRVLSGKSPDSIIPYRAILEFYEIISTTAPTHTRPVCACGCGAPVFDRKKWAKAGCRTKARRAAIRNQQFCLGQLIDFVKPSLRQNRRMATLPVTEAENANLRKLVDHQKTIQDNRTRPAATNND